MYAVPRSAARSGSGGEERVSQAPGARSAAAPAGSGPARAPVAVTSACTGCGACLLTCPEHAIRPHGRPLDVLPELCTGCLECVEVCPADAITELEGPG